MVIIDHETAQGMPELWSMTAAEINKYLGDTEVKIALHEDLDDNAAFAFEGDWRILDYDDDLVYGGIPNDEPLSTVKIVERAHEKGRKYGYNVGYAVGKRAAQKQMAKAMGY